ncbi:MAG TPA: PP2C family protein-serine/threonine phosphatase, partial [Candidatus Ozemobacteraceae bacterium]|nr:PP2C family protein-serine/threonine phosphatase [Candidatus Ozemobacteraceae bacterium]
NAWQELRHARQAGRELPFHGTSHLFDQHLRSMRDAASSLDQLTIDQPRRFRWVQIGGILAAYQNAMNTGSRIHQQLEELRWNRDAAPSRPRQIPAPLIRNLLGDVEQAFLSVYPLRAESRRELLTTLSAIAIRFQGLLETSYFTSLDEDALIRSLRLIDQELSGYEVNVLPSIRQEVTLLWRDLDTDAELFLTDSESYLTSRFSIWALALLVCLAALILLHHRITRQLRDLCHRMSECTPGRRLVSRPPTGVREIDDLERGVCRIVERFHRELQLNSRHIKATTRIWSVFNDLSRESATQGSPSSEVLVRCLDTLLNLLGEQIPALSLAKLLRATESGLIPITPDYLSPAFRHSDRYTTYTASSSPYKRLGWDDSLSGWIARHAAADPWTTEEGEESYRHHVPLRRVSELGLVLKHEQGLAGPVFGIRLQSQKNDRANGRDFCLLVLYFDDEEAIPGEADWMFISIMAHQMVSVIDTAELLDISNRQRQITSQLAIAREIQASTIPPRPPIIPGFEIDAVIRMASLVGGDYYDFIPFRDGRLGIVIADVSGKDIPAALLTMVLKTTFKALMVDRLSAPQLLIEVNRILIGILSESFFVTMAYAILDPSNRSVSIANAGHTPVLHRSCDGGTECVTNIEIPGYPLGVIETTFKERKCILKPGDTLLFYTDGVLDCRNAAGERYGQDRLTAYLGGAGSENLPARRLLTQLDTFRGDLDAPDDITVVSLNCLQNESAPETTSSPRRREEIYL